MKISVPIRGLNATVDRTIAQSMVKDLKVLSRINPNAYITIDNQLSNTTEFNGLDVDVKRNEFETPITEKISVSMKTNELADTYIRHRFKPPIHRPFFSLMGGQISMSTDYVDTKMSIDIKYQTKSKSNAEMVKQELLGRYLKDSTTFFHTFKYAYILPDDVTDLLTELSDKYNVNIPIEEQLDILEFLKLGNIDNKISLSTNVNTDIESVNLAVNEVQHRVLGRFDTEVKSVEKEFNTDNYTWEVILSYNVTYKRPKSIIITYPLLINNSMLDSLYYSNIVMQHADYTSENLTKSLIGFSKTSADMYGDNRYYITLPRLDTFRLDVNPNKFMRRIFTQLIGITKDDLTTVCNLETDLDGYSLSSDILNVLKTTEHQYMTNTFHSMFLLELYEDNKLMSGNVLTVDNLLNVTSTIPLDITKTYRVSFVIVTDVNILSARALSVSKENAFYDTVITSLVRDEDVVNKSPQDIVLTSQTLLTHKSVQMLMIESGVLITK